MVSLNSYSGWSPWEEFLANLNGGKLSGWWQCFLDLKEFLQRLGETPHVFCKLEWRSCQGLGSLSTDVFSWGQDPEDRDFIGVLGHTWLISDDLLETVFLFRCRIPSLIFKILKLKKDYWKICCFPFQSCDSGGSEEGSRGETQALPLLD